MSKESNKARKKLNKAKAKIEAILVEYDCELISANEYHNVLITRWDSKNGRYITDSVRM